MEKDLNGEGNIVPAAIKAIGIIRKLGLEHGDPIDLHWNYTDANGKKYHVHPNRHKEKE